MSNVITQEQFYAFHNIDRQLFSRIVFRMRREPSEAMQAAAFWLWLERLNMAQYIATLVNFRDNLFEAVYEETLLCLKVVDSEDGHLLHHNEVPLVQTIVRKQRDGVNLRFFHENRTMILVGVGSIIQKTCLRAFEDIIQLLVNQLKNYHDYPPLPTASRVGVIGSGRGGGRGGGGVGGGVGSSGGGSSRVGGLGSVAIPPPTLGHNQNYGNQGVYVDYPNVIRVGDFNVPLINRANRDPGASGGHVRETQSQALQRELGEIVAQMRVRRNNHMPQTQRVVEERLNTLASERTIFLTFSKGYPISEHELRDFFNRTFGNVIETLYMQEVVENEQPLYARMVVRDLRAMEEILSKHGRSKFSINGKHVWARKYVRKNNTISPPSSPFGN